MSHILVNVFGASKLGVDLTLYIAAASLDYDDKPCNITTNSFVLEVPADSYRVTFAAGSKETRREGLIEFELADKQAAVIDLQVNGKGEILDWEYAVKGSAEAGAVKAADGESAEKAAPEKSADAKSSSGNSKLKKPGKKKKKLGFVSIMWIIFFAAVIIIGIVYAVASASVGGGV